MNTFSRSGNPADLRRQGGILILALLTVGLLVSIVLSASTALRLRWALADNTLRHGEARDAALSSMARAIHLLIADTHAEDTMDSRWADASQTHGVALSDEEARIHLPSAPESVIAALFRQEAGLPERQALALAQSLILWREAQAAPVPAVDSLVQVPGLDPATLLRIAPHVTVHGEGHVNLNTTSENVLRILLEGSGSSREVQSVLLAGFRASRRHGIVCMQTDEASLIEMLVGPRRIPNASEAQAIADIAPRLGIRSTAFRGVAEGIPSSAEFPRHRIEFLYDRSRGVFLRWVE